MEFSGGMGSVIPDVQKCQYWMLKVLIGVESGEEEHRRRYKRAYKN